MARMKQLAPRGRALQPRGAPRPGQRTRDRLSVWRRWYGTAAWRRLRWSVLVDATFTCARCGQVGTGPDLVADHIAPHRGDRDLFFDRENLQCLCKACHDGAKQREERSGMATGAGSSGVMARPTWFRKTYVPVTVVCGPPGAGKSTYVRDNAGPDDLVVCFDQIARRMFGADGTGRTQGSLVLSQKMDVLRARNDMIGKLMWASARNRWPAAWIILLEPEAAHRQWWRDTVGASVAVLATPEAECLRRIDMDDAAGDRRGKAARAAVSDWWRRYSPVPDDVVVAPK